MAPTLNRRAALKATAVVVVFVAFFACMIYWPDTTATVFFTAIGALLLVVLWLIVYVSFGGKDQA